MDDATMRNLALEYAVKTPDLCGYRDVLAVAEAYLAFLRGEVFREPVPIYEAA